MNEKFAFLKSTRFWALIIGAVAIYLQQKGIFGDAEMLLTTTVTGIFIGIRTFDRSVDVLSNRALPVTVEEPPVDDTNKEQLL